MKKVIGFLMFGLVFAFSANAYALVFDFAGVGGSQTSYNFSVGGVNVTATGLVPSISSVLVHQDINGLGVTYNGEPDISVAGIQIDGRGISTTDPLFDTLVLTFDQTVTIDKATRTMLSDSDGYKLLVDDVQLYSIATAPGTSLEVGTITDTYSSGNRTGKVFKFTVTELNDDYKVKSIEVTPIPEPASMGLLGLGLLGLARRFRRK